MFTDNKTNYSSTILTAIELRPDSKAIFLFLTLRDTILLILPTLPLDLVDGLIE